jgi:predicted anti-sigma-YlaC factor YlaD
VDCSEVLELMGDYLDADLREELRQAIDQHLHGCRDCQVEVDAVQKTVTLYQHERHIATPLVVSARLQESLARAYRELAGEAEGE